jgi:methylenetetrahydrofolate dehydrogenase (NADP+)/methenyltetrahydrofolate cyclohydrolase
MSAGQESWQWGNRIRGGNLRNQVRDALLDEYGDELLAQELKVEIIRFATPEYEAPLDSLQQSTIASYEAAEDSRRVKTVSFKALGIEVPDREFLPQTTTRQEFQALINELNTDPSVNAIIVQYPVPRTLADLVATIAPEKDLDALSENPTLFPVPATSEGIMRVVEPFVDGMNAITGSREGDINIQSEAIVRVVEAFAQDDLTVAIVGSRGFVGRGVVQLLDERNINYIAIDQRDENFQEADLLRVREADIVVSATGQPGILDERHLTPRHRLVVDCGYVPRGDEKLGDIAKSAVTIPQNITPVPGGTGPIEMAILMERMVRKEIDPDLTPWRLQDYQAIRYYDREALQQQQQQWATEIYSIARGQLERGRSRIQQIRPDVEQLEGRQTDYKLIVNTNENTLSLQSKNSRRGELAKFDLGTGEIQSSSGLTAIDLQNFRSLGRQRNRDRDLER